MANFVEQATLIVKDQSTPQINKINQALKELQRTARSLKGVKIDIKVNTNDVQRAVAALRRLTAAINSTKAAGRNLNIGGGTAGLRTTQAAVTGMTRQMQAMHTQSAAASRAQLQNMQRQAFLARQIARHQQAAGGPGPGGGGGPPGGGTGGPGQGFRAGRGGRGGGLLSGPLNLTGSPAVRGLTGLGAGLTGISVGLTGATMYTLATAVGRATKQGVMDADVGRMSLAHKQLGPVERAYADQLIADIGKEKAGLPGGALLNLGQRQLSFSEALGATQGDPAGAAALTSRLEETTMTLVALGKGFEEAQEQAISFGKGFAQMGRTTDAATGAFDLEKMTSSFDYITKLMPTIGKEFTGTFFRNITKYLGATKFAITDRALGAVMMLGEETGTRAAVGYAQAVKQFSGIGLTKQAMAEQAAFGLREYTETIGKRGKITRTYKPMDEEEKRLLQTDLPGWINKKVIPLMEAKGMDPNDPQVVMDLMQRLLSHATAREAGAALTYRSQEIQRDLDIIDQRKGDVASQREINQKSVAVAAASLQNSFQSVTGEFLMAYRKPITDTMQKTSAALNAQAAKFAAGEVPDPQTMLTSLAAVAGASLIPAAFTAMQNPATAALGAAGLTLGAAGSALLTAAGALGLVAGVSIAGATPAGGKSNIPELEKQREAQERLWAVNRGLRQAEEDRANLYRQMTENTKISPQDWEKGTDELSRLDTLIAELGSQANTAVEQLNEWYKSPEKLRDLVRREAEAKRISPEQVEQEKVAKAARAAEYNAQTIRARSAIIAPSLTISEKAKIKKIEWPKTPAPFTDKEHVARSRAVAAAAAKAEKDRTTFPLAGTPGGPPAPKVPVAKSQDYMNVWKASFKSGALFGGATVSGEINRSVASSVKTIVGTIGLGGIPLPGVTTAPPGEKPELEVPEEKITSAIELGFGQGSSTAVSTLIAGSETAGSALGSAAVNAIHAGVSDLTINVTANVVGTTGGGDKGGNSVNPSAG